ncbi:MAG: TspO/MBR family protein, partial [Planktomarina sp.]|jgi:benzodiazapine receptor|nr:TspO/MBR family protein [Planktomarina sp.]MDA9100137.1 tryptophan-rich sensory protein [Planktomarina sp.]MDA9271600.1 tryptophan-rich sensory protein [Planktomarina sp.]MDS9950566.1 TspO/MBR family protein [Planktomarina sp.]|tara:strand:+ start:597 stop:1067 length:471 start_codon:yes stop_codon:yes gene_type:complete
MKSRIIVWVLFYASTLVAAGGAIWFVGDLNANKWIVPTIAPPAWLFGPVWTILYLLIATSGYRISSLKSSNLKNIALGLWALQMCLNTLWTPVFFGAFDLQGALGIIVILWLTIVSYIVVSFKIDRASSYLFMPYWVWVSFATALNFSYILVNPSI